MNLSVRLGAMITSWVSAFPRWLGYFTLWAAIAFEVGALAFMFKSGPFSWNAVLVFWMPLVVYGTWITVTSLVRLRAFKRQQSQLSVLNTQAQ